MAWVPSGCVTLHNCHGLSEVELLHSKMARLLWELKTESRFMCFCIHKCMVLPPGTTGDPQRVEVLQPGWEVMDSARVGCPPAWGCPSTQTLLLLGLAFTDRDSEALSCCLL